MIASASDDSTVALLDFKTGKKLYTGNTSDGSNFSLFDQGYSNFFLALLCQFVSFEKKSKSLITKKGK